MDDMEEEEEAVATLCESVCLVTTKKYEQLQGSWQVSVVLYSWDYSTLDEVDDTITDITNSKNTIQVWIVFFMNWYRRISVSSHK